MLRYSLPCAFVLLALAGCSPEGTGVSMLGKVTLNGQPLAEGTVQVLPTTGTYQPVGGVIQNGAYQIDNAPLGKVTIMLIATRATGRTYDDNGTQRPELENVIPPAARGGFERENRPGVNQHDIELKN